MDLSIRRTLFVLAAQPPPPGTPLFTRGSEQGEEAEFGEFRNDQSRLLFMCNDNRRLLHDGAYRAEVACRIVGGTQEKFAHIETFAVLVHKTRPKFVYAMLGLADEIKRLSLYDIRILVMTDSSNGLSPRTAVLDCLRQVQKRSPKNRVPLLARHFDASRVLDFRDVLLAPATH